MTSQVINSVLSPRWLFAGIASLALVLMVSALQAGDHGSTSQEPGAAEVALELGIYLGEGKTTVAFHLANRGTQPFKTTPVCTNYNRLVIVSPDGRREERFSWKDGIPEVAVPAGQSKTWNLDLALMPEFKEPGAYHIQWTVGKLASPEIIVVKDSQS